MHRITRYSARFISTVILLACAGCGEAMQFENAGSKNLLAQDEAACNEELSQQAVSEAYSHESLGRVDPMQTCMERKGWRRVDVPVPSSKTARL